MNLAALVIAGVSSVLLYGAIRNVNPLDLFKDTLSGKSPPKTGSWGGYGGALYADAALASSTTTGDYPKGTGKWPTTSKVVSTPYGEKGSTWSKGYHTGVDISGNRGDPIYSVTSGNVAYSQYDSDYGNNVIVRTHDGYYVLYGHMTTLHVTKGMTVKPGTNVGSMGDTGHAFGVHLHFEVRRGFAFCTDVDPMPLLRGGH